MDGVRDIIFHFRILEYYWKPYYFSALRGAAKWSSPPRGAWSKLLYSIIHISTVTGLLLYSIIHVELHAWSSGASYRYIYRYSICMHVHACTDTSTPPHWRRCAWTESSVESSSVCTIHKTRAGTWGDLVRGWPVSCWGRVRLGYMGVPVCRHLHAC